MPRSAGTSGRPEAERGSRKCQRFDKANGLSLRGVDRDLRTVDLPTPTVSGDDGGLNCWCGAYAKPIRRQRAGDEPATKRNVWNARD